MQATEGIPLLVRHFDSCLDVGDGSEVDIGAFAAVLDTYDRRLGECARMLANGGEPGLDALAPRELQLLCMAVKVARHVAEEFGLDSEFADSWEMLDEALRAGVPAPMTQPEDRLCLEVLTLCGLLWQVPGSVDAKKAPLGRVQVRTDGALARLLDALEDVRAC